MSKIWYTKRCMNQHIQTKHVVLAAVLLSLCVVILATVYIQLRTEKVSAALQSSLISQEKRLAELAILTKADSADSVLDSVIKDCSLENRVRFDAQLSRLASLSPQELKEIEPLFDACGSFFAEKKALMSLRLQREYEVFKDLMSIVETFEDIDSKYESVSTNWGLLTDLESERARLALTLVQIQKNIISELRKGTSVRADSVEVLTVEGQKTKDKLIEIGIQVNDLHTKLLTQ